MCYLKSYESCLNMLIFFLTISLLGKYCVLSDEINSSNEYKGVDQDSDDSINVIDTIGDQLLDSTKSTPTSGQLNLLIVLVY